MKSIERRDFLQKFGAGTFALAGMKAFGDVTTDGDPLTSYAPHIRYIDKNPPDAVSATLDGRRVVQPMREIPVFHETDVVVVGGGAAGVAAAVAASRNGAKVALVERSGSLGGLFTNGLVLIFVGNGVKEDGKFRVCTKGFCQEFIERLEAMGPHCITPRPAPGRVWTPTADPEAAKVLMDRMVQEAGVDVFFHAWGVDVIKTGTAVKGVVFESKEGRQAILAKQVIDTTGDGDVYFQAGADFRQITHSLGFCFQIGGMDRIDPGKSPAVKEFPVRGNQPNPGYFWKNQKSIKGNGLSVRELSAAELHHRRTAWEYVERMRSTPGYESAYLSSTCSQIGVRATRLMKGLASVAKNDPDVLSGAKRADAVAVSGSEGCTRPEFAIPYGCLIPEGVDNVLSAGRCISCSPDIIDRIRLFPVCFVTGHAAGVAAALAVKRGVTPREVDVAAIRRRLLEEGAYL
jgi:hypothetical protein